MGGSMRKLVAGILLAAIGLWWFVSAPEEGVRIQAAEDFGPVPRAVVEVTTKTDFIKSNAVQSATSLPAYDEVVLSPDESIAYAPAVDGWIWRIELAKGVAERFVEVPLMPAGAHLAPDDADVLYFCSSYLHGVTYDDEERVGLYRLDLLTRAVDALVVNVPTDQGDRPLTFCNDLDVSEDGKRIYFTEPFDYGRPSMGTGGTYKEAIALGRNGQVWMYDLVDDKTLLVAEDLVFPDGILVESNEAGGEESLLVTQTIRFDIVRVYLGERKGEVETVIENLPAMPDGMDRDDKGRIWIGMLKQRSRITDWIHRNPWIKPFVLRLPPSLLPVSHETSVLALTADGSQPLFYTLHDGSVVSDISVVIPGASVLYLATFSPESKGLFSIPKPADFRD